jgi:hypothetical protein
MLSDGRYPMGYMVGQDEIEESDMALVDFMKSDVGRAARAVVGLALIVTGLALGGGWLALSLVGLVPLAAGIFDFCLLAPLFHRSIRATHSPKA